MTSESPVPETGIPLLHGQEGRLPSPHLLLHLLLLTQVSLLLLLGHALQIDTCPSPITSATLLDNSTITNSLVNT